MKVGVHSDKNAVELPSPWSSEGGLSEVSILSHDANSVKPFVDKDYITRRSKSIWLDVKPDELSHRVEEIMRIDGEAEILNLHDADQRASPGHWNLEFERTLTPR